jgi:hypothetical protein
VALGGVQFFLGREKEEEDDSEDDNEAPNLKQLRHGLTVGKKTKSKERQIMAAKAILKKVPF